MNEYKVIKDGRVLRAISRRTELVFDPIYKYCTAGDVGFCGIEYKGETYRLMYASGCFYPYLVKLLNPSRRV